MVREDSRNKNLGVSFEATGPTSGLGHGTTSKSKKHTNSSISGMAKQQKRGENSSRTGNGVGTKAEKGPARESRNRSSRGNSRDMSTSRGVSSSKKNMLTSRILTNPNDSFEKHTSSCQNIKNF
jgi:hypothetical protein